MAVFCFILGILVFFLMVHPLIFWFIVVPLLIVAVMCFIGWLKK